VENFVIIRYSQFKASKRNYDKIEFMTPAIKNFEAIFLPIKCTLFLLIIAYLPACATNSEYIAPKLQSFSEKERELGESGKQLFESYFEIRNDKILENYLDQVSRHLLLGSQWENLSFKFQVIDSLDINAYSVPGGFIYISSGMLGFLQSEDQLAAVIGHEFGHIIGGHAVKRFKRIDDTMNLAKSLSNDIGTEIAKQVTSTFSKAIIRGYDREQELEADRFSLQLISRANYSNNSVLDTLNALFRMEQFAMTFTEFENTSKQSIFSSHPAFKQRITSTVANWDNAGLKNQAYNNDNKERYLNIVNGIIIDNYNDISLKLALTKIDKIDDIENLIKSENIPAPLSKYILLINQITDWKQLSYPTSIKWIKIIPRNQ